MSAALLEVGGRVRVLGDHASDEHLCTVTEMLSTQFTATYEVARADGGWIERTVFRFYKDRGDTWKVAN